MGFFRRLPDPLARILALFLLIGAAALIARFQLPNHLKDPQLHVSATIEREKARPVRYAGSNACADCHDEYAVKKTGYHRTLACETCHSAAQKHLESADVKPEVPRKREFCSGCHHYDAARPTGFPQINPVAHNPLKPCVSCHNPHDPKPTQVPQECQACHAEIARTKAVSPHALLECTACHSVPKEHKVTPRAVLASIPGERDFCGKCHAKSSATVGPPKVDFASHGEKYLCWQCHYPHMPEVQ